MDEDPVEQVRAALRAYSGPDDSPPMQIFRGLLDVIARLDARVDELKIQPVANIEAAVRQSLTGLRPTFEWRWRWQTWARVIAAGAFALAILGAAEAYIVGRAYYAMGSEESHRWSAWCADIKHLSSDKSFCLVPVSQ